MLGISLLIGSAHGKAQFSPGELSNAHHGLEGTKNCAQCHDVGQVISGGKCLTCHTPIQHQLDARRGYHFSVTEKKCVSCHKEHLGQEARITLLKAEDVDHTQTGFALTGKHARLECASCHDAKNVRDPDVRASLGKNPRRTYLGLRPECSSCHEDRHRGKLGTDCQSCHTTTAWKNIPKFDHTKTKFMLTGSHLTVECSKCHASIMSAAKDAPIDFSTKAYADCTPCHATPHSEKFSRETCASCHTTEGWKKTGASAFNHNLTAFRLIGKHAQVKCSQCHKPGPNNTSTLKMPHEKCTDCHADYHDGQFTAKYRNDCAKCHTEQGFSPSTFTVAQHAGVFQLTAAHGAIPCIACHPAGEAKKATFHFAALSCETCHRDPHKGEFRRFMKGRGCETCHSTQSWRAVAFDHASTKFRLEGKHADVRCEQCHRVKNGAGGGTMKYTGLAKECQSCHDDAHAAQFASAGSTDCASCHTSVSWGALVFKHDERSTFKLSGAHAKVQCGACHRREAIGLKTTVRYKPISGACESCHQGKKM